MEQGDVLKIKCYECHTILRVMEDDIIDGYYVICPNCGEEIVVLDYIL